LLLSLEVVFDFFEELTGEVLVGEDGVNVPFID
jgi:hypothetical protein